MPTKSERRKHRVYRRSAKETRLTTKSGKASKMQCALCASTLHGVPHGKKVDQLRKLSKTQRRPEAPFGGILCNNCREVVTIEAIKVQMGMKKANEVELRFAPYVQQLKTRVSVN